MIGHISAEGVRALVLDVVVEADADVIRVAGDVDYLRAANCEERKEGEGLVRSTLLMNMAAEALRPHTCVAQPSSALIPYTLC